MEYSGDDQDHATPGVEDIPGRAVEDELWTPSCTTSREEKKVEAADRSQEEARGDDGVHNQVKAGTSVQVSNLAH